MQNAPSADMPIACRPQPSLLPAPAPAAALRCLFYLATIPFTYTVLPLFWG